MRLASARSPNRVTLAPLLSVLSNAERIWKLRLNQHFLSGLEAVHDFKPFRGLFADDREGREKLRKSEDVYPPVTHPPW